MENLSPTPEFYHSWQTEFKQPFGAVKAGESARFRMKQTNDRILSVNLLIHKDGHQDKEVVSMSLETTETGEAYFSAVYTLTQGQGLYFYRFEVREELSSETSTYYLGRNQAGYGGPAYRYLNYNDCPDYQLTAYAEADPAPNWYRKGVAYHIFVDRFFNGTEDGSVLYPKDNAVIYTQNSPIPYYVKDENGGIVHWDFYGGNLKGVLQKLDYLEELGITVIYLSPIFQARSNHKYDTGDYHTIDEMFGDLTDFEELLKQTAERGMRIILDGVFNHTGADSIYFNRFGTYPTLGAYQSKDSPYHDWFDFIHHPETYYSWWGIGDLPTLNTENPAVQNFIYGSKDSVIAYWGKVGIGGWRLDVADEVTDDFLTGLRTSLEAYSKEAPVLIGEVWEDASNKVAYDQRRHYIEGGMLHGVMNYPFRELIISFLKKEIAPYDAAMRFLSLKENYPRDVLFNNLNNLGTHDTVRIKTALDGSNEKMRQAFAMLFCLPGVPTIYYGDEAGLEGYTDPDNRRPFPWGSEDKSLQAFVREWVQRRRAEAALTEGDFHLFYDDVCLYILRYLDQEEWVLSVFNPTNEPHDVDWQAVHNPEGFALDRFAKDLSVCAQAYSLLTS